MQCLDYKIEDDHLYISCNNQTSWHFIGLMKGVFAKINDNPPPAPGAAVGNHITLELNFPDSGLISFQIPYVTAIEAGKALNKANQLVKDLISFCRERKSGVTLK